MQSIRLTKRLLLYVLLFGISLLGLSFAAFSGGREQGMVYLAMCVYLIPQYIFGLFFLQTKLIIRLILPFITAIISFSSFWLIGKVGFVDMIDSVILFSFVLFFPVIIIWEIAYQILLKIR
jgi:hypothetical protein